MMSRILRIGLIVSMSYLVVASFSPAVRADKKDRPNSTSDADKRGSEPFSSKWYKDHPHAWHHDHDHDAWKVVTAAGVVGFLGWELYHPRREIVVYQPVPYDTLFVSRPGVIIDPSRGDWMPLGVYS